MIEVGGLGAVYSFDSDAVKIWSQSERFTISVSDKFIGKDFQVISLTGNVVYSGTLRELKTQIDTVLLPEGIYNVLIDSTTLPISRKVYKH
jgi:hypothetical protein